MKKYPEPLIFGLDIGTRSIVGTVGYKEQDSFNIVAMAVKYHETRSMIDGQIHDVIKVSDSINAVKEQLEKQLDGRKLTDVCIAAAGRVLKTAVGHGEYEFEENTLINHEYIHSIDLYGVDKAHDIIFNELKQNNESTKYYCVGYTVIKYYLNGYEITNLEDQKGTKIAADVLATFLPEEVVSSLYSAVEMAGLNVLNLTLEPIAAMNVAVPEQYRLLNIALIDIGAGTSDICITKDGSIIAYGMIPSAGDELTETLMKKYLIDFDTAEKLKKSNSKKLTITYKDIMGVAHKTPYAEVLKTIEAVEIDLAQRISDKIIELNGGTTVSAVFLVGGGGKVAGFTDMIAKYLKLPKERVAIRGKEVMNDININVEGIKKDSLYVTPIGICLNYYDQKNNFIFVNVNGQRVKLYNNDKITVFDAAVKAGFSNDDIFPKRGADITFKINGKNRIVRGYTGEAAIILVNDNPAGMNTLISANDRIQITESTAGKAASVELSSLPEYNGTLEFVVNGVGITCPKFSLVNGNPESQLYNISDGDVIEMQQYYTLEQLFTFMDITDNVQVFVNNKQADSNTKIYDNFEVNWIDITVEDYDNKDDIESKDVEENKTEKKEEQSSSEVIVPYINNTINVICNDTPVRLTGKNEYTFVNIFDYYPFDLTTMKGSKLITLVDGHTASYTEVLKDGAQIKIYWEK